MELKSVEKALDILESFTLESKEQGVTEISRALGINPTSVYKILKSLKTRGYVSQDSPKGKYRLGIKLFELGSLFQEQVPLIKLARPFLEKLGAACGETINLAVLSADGSEILYIDKIESSEVLKTDIRLGTRLPAHCTALGKALLSTLSEQEIDRFWGGAEELPALTAQSLSTRKDLEKELAAVKERGWAVDNEEFRKGVRCVAAPLRDRLGKSPAAVSITGPSSRITAEQVDTLAGLLLKTAQTISASLGYNGKIV